jgi:hypothetical protein
MALTLSTVIATAAVVFLVLHEPSRVAGWREKAARLDKHCARVLIHYESERSELADLRYRAKYMERLRETQPYWKPDLTNLCTQEPLDTSHRLDCLYRRDFECLIAFDVAIETAIKQR